MKTSESIKTIAPALLAAKKAFKPALKTAENPHFKSKYVDLQSVVDATEDALSLNGLVLLQSPEISEGDKMVSVVSRLIHISGEWIEGTISLPSGTPTRYDAQTVGSAITYARRYSYMGILGIAPEDDDGSTASGSHAVAKAGPQPVRTHPISELDKRMSREALATASAIAENHARDINASQGDAYEPDGPVFDRDGDMVEAKSTVQHREQKQASRQDKPTKEERKDKGWISEGQEKRFWFFVKQSGLEQAEVKSYLTSLGVTDISQLPWKKYGAAIVWAGGPAEERA